MANLVPFAFKGELMSGSHNFSAGGNAFKLALYTANPFTTASTVYVTTSEVSGAAPFAGYQAGGKALNNQVVDATTATTTVDFDNLTWGAATTGAATFGAAFAAIYNTSTNPVNKLVVVLDFQGTKTATNGDFTIAFPNPNVAANAILSLTSS